MTMAKNQKLLLRFALEGDDRISFSPEYTAKGLLSAIEAGPEALADFLGRWASDDPAGMVKIITALRLAQSSHEQVCRLLDQLVGQEGES